MKQQSMDAEPWALEQVACLKARIFACICKYEYTCQNRETNWKESIMKKTFAVLGNMQLGVSRFTKQFPAWMVLHWGVASWFLLPYVLQSSTEDSSEAFDWLTIVSSHHVLYCTCVHINPYTDTPIINLRGTYSCFLDPIYLQLIFLRAGDWNSSKWKNNIGLPATQFEARDISWSIISWSIHVERSQKLHHTSTDSKQISLSIILLVGIHGHLKSSCRFKPSSRWAFVLPTSAPMHAS